MGPEGHKLNLLETERLILKPTTLADFDLYREILSYPNLTKYLPKGAPYTEQEVTSYVDKRIEHWNRGFGSYIVYLKSDSNKKIGYAGVERSPNPQCSDIRYGFTLTGQGKGYAFEAAKAVVEHTFQSMGLTEIFGISVRNNIRSIAILKKLGMVENNSVVLYDKENLVTLSITNFLERV